MNYIISGKNIEVTEGLRNAVQDKLSKLEKYFAADTGAQVTFSVEKDRQKIEVTIPMKGHIIRAEQVSDDMYVSIDLVVEVIERQVTKHRKKLIDKEQNVAYLNDAFVDEDVEDDDDIKIVRTKKFEVKPMYPEDACIHIISMYSGMQSQMRSMSYTRERAAHTESSSLNIKIRYWQKHG